MAQIIYCSQSFRRQSGLLPPIEKYDNDLMEKTFSNIYCIFGDRTFDNQFSYYYDTDGKRIKLSINQIMNLMKRTRSCYNHNTTISVWNDIIRLNANDYQTISYQNMIPFIVDYYVREVYQTNIDRYQVTSNVRYHNITKDVLIILTICTTSYSKNETLLDIGSDSLWLKSRVLKDSINNYVRKRINCKVLESNDVDFKYEDYRICRMIDVVEFE